MSYYIIFLFFCYWGLCMLTFLDNCPIFVLQHLRGKTVSCCRGINNPWSQKRYCGFTMAALLCSSAAGTLFLQQVFFLFVEMSCMKTSWQPDTNDASQGSVLGPILFKILINSLGNKMGVHLTTSMDGLKLGGVEGIVEALLGCYSEGAQQARGVSQWRTSCRTSPKASAKYCNWQVRALY